MLSMYDSEQFLFESLKAGASGYVLKSEADQDIVEAVRRTMRGQSFLYHPRSRRSSRTSSSAVDPTTSSSTSSPRASYRY